MDVQFPVQHGGTGTLGSVHISVVDAWGNAAVPAKALDVTLENSAMAADGTGACAKVTAQGSNRCKMDKGQALFKNVQISGADGEYTLSIRTHGRAVVRLLRID